MLTAAPGLEEFGPGADLGMRLEQCSTLSLGHPTPHPELDTMIERVRTALDQHRAIPTHRRSLTLRCPADEKFIRITLSTTRPHHPIDSGCGLLDLEPPDRGTHVHRFPSHQTAHSRSARNVRTWPSWMVIEPLRPEPNFPTTVHSLDEKAINDHESCTDARLLALHGDRIFTHDPPAAPTRTAGLRLSQDQPPIHIRPPTATPGVPPDNSRWDGPTYFDTLFGRFGFYDEYGNLQDSIACDRL